MPVQAFMFSDCLKKHLWTPSLDLQTCRRRTRAAPQARRCHEVDCRNIWGAGSFSWKYLLPWCLRWNIFEVHLKVKNKFNPRNDNTLFDQTTPLIDWVLVLSKLVFRWSVHSNHVLNYLLSSQSRTEFTILTERKFFSMGRCLRSAKRSCNTLWKSAGVSKCLWASIHDVRTLNHLSTSSCECPLCKKRNSILRSLCAPVRRPPSLMHVLFFTSRDVLSACTTASNCRRSWWVVQANLFRVWVMISHDQLLSLRTKGCPRAITIPCPCSIEQVKSKVGRMQPLNSLLWNMAVWRGHLYFWWSMPSTMRQTVCPESTNGRRLWARHCQ